MKRFKFFKFLILITLALIAYFLFSARAEGHCSYYSHINNKTTEKASKILKALVDSSCNHTNKNTQVIADRLYNFYDQNNYELSWMFNQKQPTQSKALLSAVQKAPEEGLKVESYPLQEAQKWEESVNKNNKPSPKQLARRDYWLTRLYLSYSEDLLSGRFKPEKIDTTFKRHPRTMDLAHYLATALQNNRVTASLEDLAPKLKLYELLKKQLIIYKKRRENNSWDKVEGKFLLKVGDSHEQVPLIYERLAITQDLDTSTSKIDTSASKVDRTIYTTTLAKAVERFQKRHGLATDGIVGSNTLTAMNQSVDKKIRQIKMNMERLRWMPDDLGDWYILVNVPAFELQLIDKKQKALHMKVVTGKELWPTPLFSDTINHLVFSPTWTPTLNIIFEDLIPRMQKKDNYFERKNLVVYDSWDADANTIDHSTINWGSLSKADFPYRITQQPGPQNSLGQVKFMFPNTMSIYLHDTPHEQAFEEPDRDQSHGCVRVDKPKALATYILEKQEEAWDSVKVKEYMNKSTPTKVNLDRTIPVHLVYWTVWIDEKGALRFSEDIYGLDESQSELM